MPGTTTAWKPVNWSIEKLSYVTPCPMPKYFGLGPALSVRTGTTKRSSSAEATSPPPQDCASGIVVW